MRRAIHIENLSKRFTLQREQNLKTFVMNALRNRITREQFWALQNVSLDVQKGETFGIVGANGSGKSTLLKLVAGILTPTEGSIDIDGVVAPIINLGVGFNPDLTGKENLYLNASLYGLGRDDIDRIYDDIVAFSELGEFIEEPIKTYSSGMKMRLGFSIAVHIDPDVLLIDEVLAVGDEKFQEKCMEKINQLQRDGKTILFVSHSAAQVRELCSRVCLLENGEVVDVGPSDTVLAKYAGILETDADAQVREL
ncbi:MULTISPECIES: ABC transporter ATP-binding protein [Halorussus]|uniref:ABC transporter ATP-binding protein n=1 Tax=Halorussus TaxID=1070314 RepID=UPI00209F164E|nr:ABC transporter ATP-binding protein [Halorussus vallis]USZ77390.1 ABC transporter ATP-binding protein [Halorussus vallis]